MKRILSLLLVLLVALAAAASVAEMSPQNETPPPEIEKIIEDHQTIFRLTIYYIYPDGTTAAPTYRAVLNAGTRYNVPSPRISGYTPTMSVVSGVMPARDVEYTVIYIPRSSDGTPIDFLTIEDYETPLGFGASFMHKGICIE